MDFFKQLVSIACLMAAFYFAFRWFRKRSERKKPGEKPGNRSGG